MSMGLLCTQKIRRKLLWPSSVLVEDWVQVRLAETSMAKRSRSSSTSSSSSSSSSEVSSNVAPTPQTQRTPQRKFRTVYTFAFSHTEAEVLRKPGDVTREEFADMLACAHRAVFEDHQDGVRANILEKGMVFQELHADGHQHLYAITLAERPYGPERVRAQLRTQYRISEFWHESFILLASRRLRLRTKYSQGS